MSKKILGSNLMEITPLDNSPGFKANGASKRMSQNPKFARE